MWGECLLWKPQDQLCCGFSDRTESICFSCRFLFFQVILVRTGHRTLCVTECGGSPHRQTVLRVVRTGFVQHHHTEGRPLIVSARLILWKGAGSSVSSNPCEASPPCRCRNDVYHLSFGRSHAHGICGSDTDCLNARRIEWKFIDSAPPGLAVPDVPQFAWRCQARIPWYAAL